MISSIPTIDSVEVERVESDGEKVRILLCFTLVDPSLGDGRSNMPLDFHNTYGKTELLHRLYLVCKREVERLELVEKMKNAEGVKV